MVLLCINIPSCNLLFAMKAMAQLQMIYGLLVLMIFSILKLPGGERWQGFGRSSPAAYIVTYRDKFYSTIIFHSEGP